jgi:crotonobetainyl-CoA:carnitine CoA-transferase CaiB-like acyl-CoA transferase
VDLTSLWAGPLCGHLLGLAGCRVVKVESSRRPDGARRGAPGLYDLLHAGQEAVALDFTDPDDVARLRKLVESADVVLEASRPRALRQLGIEAERAVEAGATWASITANGRRSAWSHRVGLGDDVAAAAGLVADHEANPWPAGDALADPLTGVHAAAAVVASLLAGGGFLLDISMYAVAAAAAALPGGRGTAQRTAGGWVVDGTPVADPSGRRVSGKAAELGADTDAVLGEVA